MKLLRDPYFIAVGLSHLATDIINSQKAIFIVFLASDLGLNNAHIGLVYMAYTACGALTQPLFGLLADRYHAYWLSGVGLLWIASWFGVAVLAPGLWAIPALIIGSLGSAALHSSGTERATARGRVITVGGAATAASLFFLFGQTGFAIGPAAGGLLLEKMGPRGLLVLVMVSFPIAVNSLYWMYVRKVDPVVSLDVAESDVNPLDSSQNVLRQGWWVMASFGLFIMLRTTPQSTTMTFLPKLFEDRGYSPSTFGAIASIFMVGSAVGGVVGGILCDRWGRRPILIWTLIAAAVPMYLYPVAVGLEVYPLVLLAGLFIGASHSVIVVVAQTLLPSSGALASGLALGFMFASGSAGSFLFGMAADVFPLASVLQVNGVLSLCAALLSLILWQRSAPALGNN